MTGTKKGTKRVSKKLKLKKDTIKDLDAKNTKGVKGGGWNCSGLVTGCLPTKQV